jgi:hypothetical protein
MAALLPANYRSFAHGYAVTAHRSQGKTVDSVILSGDGMQKELFYVAASRGRHSVTVITSDKERLTADRGPVHGTKVGHRAWCVARGRTRIEVWRWRETWFEERPNMSNNCHQATKGARS